MPTTATRFVAPLTEDQISTFESLWQESDTHRERTRALAILLSHRQFSIEPSVVDPIHWTIFEYK